MNLDNDYDKQIADLRRKMDELEQLKNMHVRKLEGVQRFQDLVATLVKDYGMTESELFVSRSEAIVDWIKTAGKDAGDRPLFWCQLRDYYAGVIEKEQKPHKRGARKSAVSTLKEPTLPTGVYRNPFSGEKIEKKRRNPKMLDQWIADFGFAEVRSWQKK